MRLYHGSPKKLRRLIPHKSKGLDDFENKRAIFLTKSFKQASLYALGKSLKGKTFFALPPGKLIILGNNVPKSRGYVYEVRVNATKGLFNQYFYEKPIRKFKISEINIKNYQRRIVHVNELNKFNQLCLYERKKFLNKNKCFFPRVNFYISHPKKYLKVILRFLNPSKGEWNWKRKILSKYSSLEELLKNQRNFETRKNIILNFFKKEHASKLNNIKIKKRDFKKEWKKYEERFFMALLESIGTCFYPQIKKIRINLTLNPICPRYIKTASFDIYSNFNSTQAVAVCMHEITHFLYFKKYKEMLKKYSFKCDKNLSLHLSEIVPYLILNSKKFQDILEYNHLTYQEYFNIKIKGKSLVRNMQDFFDKRETFEEFLKEADKFFFKNGRKIKESLKN